MTASAYSTNMNSNYMLSNFIPTKTDSNGKPVIDVYNINMLRATNALKAVDTDVYVAGQKLPCLAYKKTGYTTPYWMMALISGILHPYRMNGGDVYYTPSIALIQAALSTGTQNDTQNTYETMTI